MDVWVENVVKSYENNVVLDVKELFIKKGSVCAVIGANGAGKTTLLKVISGLVGADKGFVYYGKEKSKEAPFGNMTLVFQKPYLLRTTVEKNIAYPLKLRGWGKARIEKRVGLLTEMFGISALRRQKAFELSGGEMQKAALARALAFEPELLLLDEPTANIDPTSIKTIEAALKETNKRNGSTIVIITHNIQQTARLCSDVVFMDGGKVIEYGSCERVLKSPDKEATKEFLMY